MQLFKFGTIDFFLVSGFLLGERIDQCEPRGYIKRRLRTICKPWMFWLSLWCIMTASHDIWRCPIALHSWVDIVRSCLHYLKLGIFHTPFWFVPNLIFSLAILLVIRDRITDKLVPVVLILVSAFYALNIYKQWLPVPHTEAFGGYIFYLWLGAWAARRYASIEGWLSRVSMLQLAAFTLLMFFLAVKETGMISNAGLGDGLNTLRVTNQFVLGCCDVDSVQAKKACFTALS
jgi:fucose 4-O-acetylase-like acetyltransferase